jgi:SAM-dependent methyltransferase
MPLRERLTELLAGDLDFHEAASDYGSHALHAFAAKFPPQIPRLFIRGLCSPGAVVLDPMMGSGTAVVEAALAGCLGLGVDLDPLALRLSSVKTRPLDPGGALRQGDQVLQHAAALLAEGSALEGALSAAFDPATSDFLAYWFLPQTQRELLALSLAIRDVPDAAQRAFLELVFSSIIVTKSGGVSLARDLAHSRPHLDKAKKPRPALAEYARRLRKSVAGLGELGRHMSGTACTLHADARGLPLADEVVDLIVTSPPYANAIDYMRAHKFSLVWLGRRIGELSEVRAQYIGAERVRAGELRALPELSAAMVERLAALDGGKARVLHKYLCDMLLALREMHRVLKHDAAAVVVVGTSTMRGLNVETHECLAELGVAAGFVLSGIATRRLDRDRRMMPARPGARRGSSIELRMHEEHVIGLHKE